MPPASLVSALWVGAGGFLGALLRWGLGGFVHQLAPRVTFPIGILVVNALGCLAIGFVGGLADARALVNPNARLFLAIGLLGGFTTFSSFGYDTIALLRDGAPGRAALNVALQIVVGLGAVAVGYAASRNW